MEETTRKKKRLILLISLVIALVCGWFAYRHFTRTPTEPTTVVSGDFLPDGKDAQRMSEEELNRFAQTAADQSKFNLIISPEATIDHQSLQGELLIKNPVENGHPINVEIREKATNNLVYTSGAIKPGYEIKQVTLEESLEKGEHEAIAMFSLYDPETHAKKGQVAAGLTLLLE